MSKSNRKSRKPWTNKDVSSLRSFANRNTPTRVISFKIGRTPEAVYAKASQEGISLKQTNQSPYNRSKK